MYPFLRLALADVGARRAATLPLEGVHVSRVTCLPFDIDPWRELNNGRTLTLYDLGRIPLVIRVGLAAILRRQGWGIAIAGASVRYRRRVRAWDRLEMRCSFTGARHAFSLRSPELLARSGADVLGAPPLRGNTCGGHRADRGGARGARSARLEPGASALGGGMDHG
jgi:hypothetical protein